MFQRGAIDNLGVAQLLQPHQLIQCSAMDVVPTAICVNALMPGTTVPTLSSIFALIPPRFVPKYTDHHQYQP